MAATATLAFLLLGLARASSADTGGEPVVSTVDGRLNSNLPLDGVRVVLNGGAYSAIPRQDGSFQIHSVRPGTYLLEVQDVQSVWPMVRLDVSAKAAGKMRALLTHNRQPVPFPLPLEPLVAKPVFFEKREGFNWAGMLMNPMVLMMGVTLLIMVAFPKMMANMDPEQLKEMQQMQGGLSDMLNPDKLKDRMEKEKEKQKETRQLKEKRAAEGFQHRNVYGQRAAATSRAVAACRPEVVTPSRVVATCACGVRHPDRRHLASWPPRVVPPRKDPPSSALT
eukprot:CAMPEP_0206153794 /NCGR_PEP_ID=MMETSP1474-20131121/896_1 /ASSEMBLY_ACC=CAM_ASM_001110 /TAXON_ID=97495 /ORGANISM="Imantonia sp., Strain RCC918" /LENGTH=279 /DNA_ID=CAMNT_0053551747 /DNA_START=47 /DNA_END=887 /DNA_ORIENTATION=-